MLIRGFNGWNHEPCRLLSHRMRSNSVYLGVEYIAKGELRESLRQIIDQFSGRGVNVYFAVRSRRSKSECTSSGFEFFGRRCVSNIFSPNRCKPATGRTAVQPGTVPGCLKRAVTGSSGVSKGDVQTATAMVQQARQTGFNFQNAADRPEIIEQMIARPKRTWSNKCVPAMPRPTIPMPPHSCWIKREGLLN